MSALACAVAVRGGVFGREDFARTDGQEGSTLVSRPAWTRCGFAGVWIAALMLCLSQASYGATPVPTAPAAARGSISAERMGTLDAGSIRTRFYNFGMVGDYPSNPGSVDLSVFHSLEAPKGSGMNYSDGITPFLLARVVPSAGDTIHIMETGYRERQALNSRGQMIRLEPRPGYFQEDPSINVSRSPAMSNDPRTWPASWPDKLDDAADPGWPGSWNGYAGKTPVATLETYMVLDDQAYDTWPRFVPDARDSTRRGLALRYDVRSLQWSEPGARDVIFWYYDITNEGTTRYADNLVFGLYSDPGIGGSGMSCDGVYESDDDLAYWERSSTRNMAYCWDYFGHGVDLSSSCAMTGYMGWSFMQTPGNSGDGIDNDLDGLTDERQDSGPGTLIVGQGAIRSWFAAHGDTVRFQARYGSLESRPPYQHGWWWTGDEDMDWNEAFDDVGADGRPGTHDRGEGDRIPTAGEPHFDQTDPDESDQLGLTGFKLNRISKNSVNPSAWDKITFANLDGVDSPHVLYDYFTSPVEANRYDQRDATNWNIAFLFASGPFSLEVGETKRFSIATGYAPTMAGLRQTMDHYRTTSGVAPDAGSGRPGCVLLGNSPNPFTRSTRIGFVLPEAGRVQLRVFDLQGRVLAIRDAGLFAAGERAATLDASGFRPGLYLYRMDFTDPAGGAVKSSLGGKLVVIN